MKSYEQFLAEKAHIGNDHGFDPIWVPEWLYPFQRDLVEWSVRKGRGAIFAECGLGKTPMQLVWAENVVRQTGRPVLIVTPLAVSYQTVREAAKFDIEARRSTDGCVVAPITVTNYERLALFNPDDFAGVVCDESSAIKNFAGKRRKEVTQFVKHLPYRLLCTATAAPNDYVELGTSSEALGELGRMDMLSTFFVSDDKVQHIAYKTGDFWNRNKFRFKAHAETPFWRWVCSWARAVRKPSDLGHDDGPFLLPELRVRQHVIEGVQEWNGELFPRVAVTLDEQREERRATVRERCERVAELVSHDEPAVVWCHMNEEGDLLERLIPGAAQVAGKDSDEQKEERFLGFADGTHRVLITKPRIGGFGLNWQHCHRMTFFPSHSFEQYYQGVRRCLRFGQSKPVEVDIVTTEGEAGVMGNLQKKADAADKLFVSLVEHMTDQLRIDRTTQYQTQETLPSWL